MLILNIGASLLAFYAFIMFLDDAVNWFGRFAGWEELTFSYLLGYILYPLAYIIGIDPDVRYSYFISIYCTMIVLGKSVKRIVV